MAIWNCGHYPNGWVCLWAFYGSDRLAAAWSIKSSPLSLACENIRFSSLFVAGDVSHETSSAAKSEEKRMFSQATLSLTLSILLYNYKKVRVHLGYIVKSWVVPWFFIRRIILHQNHYH